MNFRVQFSYIYFVFFTHIMTYTSVSKTVLLADPFWFQKITADPHIPAHLKVACLEDEYPELKICISELILDR